MAYRKLSGRWVVQMVQAVHHTVLGYKQSPG